MKVFIVNTSGADVELTNRMYLSFEVEIAESIWEADLVHFAEGPDVCPSLYGQPVSHHCNMDVERDHKEVLIWKLAKKYDLPCVGVCRGAQFLHVMNGGALFQHVEGHEKGFHDIYDFRTEKMVRVPSMHHQMMDIRDLKEKHEVLAAAACCNKTIRLFHTGHEGVSYPMLHKHYKSGKSIHSEYHDPEVIYFPNSNDLCAQFYPQMITMKAARDYFNSLLSILFLNSGEN